MAMSFRLIISALLVSIIAMPATAADNSAGGSDVVHGGGVVCLSLAPPPERQTTCNRLCAARDAVCVGLKANGAMNPGIGCGDAENPKLDGHYVGSCRCCALGK